ncbi:MAG: hypothetical protein KBA28_09665 [Syntrophaceae bacterium]|jgi:hypothetical protein|nr:hypothetical protein [Syntrophaceae bacterium]
MDVRFSILNFSEINRQAAKVAALSKHVKEISLHIPDIPLNDTQNKYPCYTFVVTLNLNTSEMNAMLSQCPSEIDFDGMLDDINLDNFKALSDELNKMESAYDKAIPADIDKVLEIAQAFRYSWTTNRAGMKQNIERFYNPNSQPTNPLFWDMIILARDSGYPADLRTDAEGKMRVWPDEPAPAAVEPSKEEKPTTDKESDYVFRREGAFWQITFDGRQSKSLPDVKGMKYIHFLLKHPRKNFSCLSLNLSVDGAPADCRGDAISEGLYADHGRQPILTPQAWKEYEIELAMLENADDAGDPQSDMIRKERIAWLKKQLNTKNFKDEYSDMQSLVGQNLKTAYKKILTDPAMKEAVEHFRDKIKTDGNMGLIYKGDFIWRT